ncbi:MAG: cytochrome c maturation protein CcmE [Anaerolineae bacterium]|nr:cytochrome c maturation protein CcmE [Anaerolineae bacterium]
MAQLAWEKTGGAAAAGKRKRGSHARLKFLIGGGLILAAVLYLALSGTMTGARFFISVAEVAHNPALVGQSVRLTGAVLGESIVYDSQTGDLRFTVAHIPDTFDDLAAALHQAVNDPARTRLVIQMENQVMPDLLRHEAQAIVSGKMGSDGIFYATELNLKCPSRFEDGTPDLTAAQS